MTSSGGFAVKRRLSNSSYWLLEAINSHEGERRLTLADAAGISDTSVYFASRRLLFYGAIAILSGRYFLTERGRIVLALARGKQQWKRHNAVGRARGGFDMRYLGARP